MLLTSSMARAMSGQIAVVDTDHLTAPGEYRLQSVRIGFYGSEDSDCVFHLVREAE